MQQSAGRKPPDYSEQTILNAADRTIAKARAEVGRAPTTVLTTPMQRRPVLPTSPKMRKAFEAYLDDLIDRAFATDPGPAEDRTHDAEHGARIESACMLCHGHCCLNGGPSNAFLTVEDVNRFRRENPGATPDDVRSAYYELMPEKTVLLSCVFHGPVGCTMPRTMRSDLCNSALCSSQRHLIEGEEGGDTAAVLVAEFRNRPVAVAAHSAKTGFREIPTKAGEET
ncbi:MAG: hypothetical protein AAGD13_21615 [Pseudomonadota bacterium]